MPAVQTAGDWEILAIHHSATGLSANSPPFYTQNLFGTKGESLCVLPLSCAHGANRGNMTRARTTLNGASAVQTAGVRKPYAARRLSCARRDRRRAIK